MFHMCCISTLAQGTRKLQLNTRAYFANYDRVGHGTDAKKIYASEKVNKQLLPGAQPLSRPAARTHSNMARGRAAARPAAGRPGGLVDKIVVRTIIVQLSENPKTGFSEHIQYVGL